MHVLSHNNNQAIFDVRVEEISTQSSRNALSNTVSLRSYPLPYTNDAATIYVATQASNEEDLEHT